MAPKSKTVTNTWIQSNIHTYGGGLWTTWFDKDLRLGGRVVVKKDNNKLEAHLYDSVKSIAKIPSLAIHFGTLKGDEFKINKEANLKPVLSTATYEELNEEKAENTDSEIEKKHWKALLRDIASKCGEGVDINDIVDFDLCFGDGQEAKLIGMYDEFISSPRLDNLFSSWFALQALITKSDKEFVDNCEDINVVALFDHEEIGSNSITGADSNLLPSVLERTFQLLDKSCNSDSMHSCFRRSFLVSADMAHATHPNWGSQHQASHNLYLNKGLCLKYNHNQRYTTNS